MKLQNLTSIGLCGYLDGCSPLLSPSARRTLGCIHIPDPWCWRASGFGYWNLIAGNWSKMTGHQGHSSRSGGSGNCEGKSRWEDVMTQEYRAEKAKLHGQANNGRLKGF